MKKYCAFGELGYNRVGKLVELHFEYIIIEADGKWKEYWDPRYVKIFEHFLAELKHQGAIHFATIYIHTIF